MMTEQVISSTLVAIRVAHHSEITPKYDRVVFEFNGPLPLLRVEYVAELFSDGTGLPVPIAGNAILCVQFTPAYAHDELGEASAPVQLRPRLPLVNEIVGSGDFEAVVTYGIGLNQKAETRILTLANKNRLVIDFLLP